MYIASRRRDVVAARPWVVLDGRRPEDRRPDRAWSESGNLPME